jgi:hypothetical protein
LAKDAPGTRAQKHGQTEHQQSWAPILHFILNPAVRNGKNREWTPINANSPKAGTHPLGETT